MLLKTLYSAETYGVLITRYLLGFLNAKFVESDGNFGNQDSFNLNEDGIFTDIYSQFPRNSEALEIYVVTVPMKL
jgi:hypothetical protein